MRNLFIVSVILGSLLFGYGYASWRASRHLESTRSERVTLAAQCVQKNFDGQTRRLSQQLSAFAQMIQRDRDFAMTYLIENDLSSPQITGFAGRYLEPMGLSLLEVTDSSYRVLSSGHFKRNAGNTISYKRGYPEGKAVLVADNITGKKHLTIQMRLSFELEGVPLFCFGGWVVDSSYLSKLAPDASVDLVLSHEREFIATSAVESISKIEDRRLILNNVVRYAATADLPVSTPEQQEVAITVIGDTPQPTSFLTFLR